jgi:hypothetical protein
MKHNSDCKPDRGSMPYNKAPSRLECECANNHYMWMLYYQADREREKLFEWANWCLREGRKIRGLLMPKGWEV